MHTNVTGGEVDDHFSMKEESIIFQYERIGDNNAIDKAHSCAYTQSTIVKKVTWSHAILMREICVDDMDILSK